MGSAGAGGVERNIGSGHRFSCVLCRQTLTTFGATASQYLAAAFGSHTGTETVIALTLQITGLESSFHDTTALVCSSAGGPIWLAHAGVEKRGAILRPLGVTVNALLAGFFRMRFSTIHRS